MITYADLPRCTYTVFPIGEKEDGSEEVAFLKTGWLIQFDGGVDVRVKRRWLKNKGLDRKFNGLYARDANGKRIEMPHVIEIIYKHKEMLRYSGNLWRKAWIEQGEYSYEAVKAIQPQLYELIIKGVALAEAIAEDKRQSGGGGGGNYHKGLPIGTFLAATAAESLPQSEEECRNFMELREFRQRRSKERNEEIMASGGRPHYPYADPVLETLSRKAVKETPDFLTKEGRETIENRYSNWQAQVERRIAQLEGTIK